MFTRTLETLRLGIEQGLHAGAQIYVSQHGNVLLDEAVGESRIGVPMTRDSINWWMSAVKPITAVAVAQLWERGKLELDDRVAQFIPEFAAGGKEAITLRHLLTHTGGFRAVSSNTSPDPWEKIIAEICAAPIEPGWVPGQKAGYHLASSWFILAEILQRITGRSVNNYLREEIFLPLQMIDCWLGLPPAVFQQYGDRVAVTYSTEKHPPDPAHPPVNETVVGLIRPGSNGRGPIRQLARFYEMVLNNGSLDGARIVSSQTVAAMTARHRAGMMDLTFRQIVDFGLGFLINSEQYNPGREIYGYGQYASPRTFGHSGNQTSCAFCDPQNALVAAWLCNGTPGELRHQVRQRMINESIFLDLGIG